MSERAPMPFIVGRGRSGTTLLRAMLDSHPDLAVTHEAHFISDLAKRRDRYERAGEGVDVELLAGDIERTESWVRLRMSSDELRATLADAAPVDYAAAMRALLDAYAANEGKARAGDKTLHLDHLGRLAELFPEARFVHIVRDGRNSLLAYRARGFGPQDAAQAGYRWRQGILGARRAAADFAPDRYLELRYEDLVRDPEPELRSVCAFLDLSYDDAMLEFQDRAAQVVAGVRGASRGNFERLREPVQPEVRSWRTELPRHDVATFQAIAGPVLRDLGYDLDPDASRVRGSMAAGWGWVRWKAGLVPKKVTYLVRQRRRRSS